MSINVGTLPDHIKAKGLTIYRSMTLEGEEIEFRGGFTELHTDSYREILNGNGFGLDETRKSVDIIHSIRNSKPIGLKGEYRPFAKFSLNKHPLTK